jgi:hypothetical protein
VVHNIFGVETRAAKPEYLVWLCASSDKDRDFADAATLASEWPIDAAFLLGLLEAAGDTDALARVDHILAAGKRDQNSSYNKSVDALLKRRRVGAPTPVWKVSR